MIGSVSVLPGQSLATEIMIRQPFVTEVTDLEFVGDTLYGIAFEGRDLVRRTPDGVWERIALDGMGDVEQLEVDSATGTLFVAGRPSSGGCRSGGVVGRWVAGQWSVLGRATTGTGDLICVPGMAWDAAGGRLFVSGVPGIAGPQNASVAYFRQGQWHALPPIAGAGVLAVDTVGQRLLAIGRTDPLTHAYVSTLVEWRNGSWSTLPVPSGFNDIADLAVDGFNGDIVIAPRSGSAPFWRLRSGSWTQMGNFAVYGTVRRIQFDPMARTFWAISSPSYPPSGAVVRWNGVEWQDLGPELSDVRSMAFDATGGRAVFSGKFSMAGNVISPYLVARDGLGRWVPMSGDNWTTGPSALAWDDQARRLFVGFPSGQRTVVGGVNVGSVGQWTAASGWQAFPPGLQGDMHLMRWLPGASGGLVVAGTHSSLRLTSSPGSSLALAMYRNGQWVRLDDSAGVSAMAVDRSRERLYVAGTFYRPSGSTEFAVSRWTGSAWQDLGAVPITVVSMVVDESTGDLFVAGGRSGADAAIEQQVLRWDGSTWREVGSTRTPSSQVTQLAWSPGRRQLFALTENPALRRTAVRVWDGSRWSDFPMDLGAGEPRQAMIWSEGTGTLVLGSGSDPALFPGAQGPVPRGSNGCSWATLTSLPSVFGARGAYSMVVDDRHRVIGVDLRYDAPPAATRGPFVSMYALPTDINFPPAINGVPDSSRTTAYTEDSVATPLVPDSDACDLGVQGIHRLIVEYSSGYVPSEDIIEVGDADPAQGFQIARDGASGRLTVTASGASQAAWRRLVRSIGYRNTSQAPTTSVRYLVLRLFDQAGLESKPVQVAVGVNAVNDVPTLQTVPSLQGTEDTPLPLELQAEIGDVDGEPLTVTLSTLSGVLQINGSLGVSVPLGGGPTVVLSGSPAGLRTALRSGAIRFLPSPDANGQFRLEVSARDAAGAVATSSTSIFVAPVNDAPRFATSPTIQGPLRIGSVATYSGGIATDVDGDAVAYRHRWLADGVPIAGAVARELTITPDLGGRMLGVEVTASDGALDAVATSSRQYVPLSSLTAVPDRLKVRRGVEVEVDVMANDLLIPRNVRYITLSIATPAASYAVRMTRGRDPVDPSDDRIGVMAGPGARPEDSFRYRLCEPNGNCVEQVVALSVDLIPAADATLVVHADRGYRDVALSPLPVLPGARFDAHGLVAPSVFSPSLTADATPESPFDAGGTATTLRTFAAGASARTWRVFVDARSLSGGDVDVYLGLDANGNGQAESNEVACAAAMSTVSERCELVVNQAANVAARYWVLLHSRSGAQNARAELFEVPVDRPLVQRQLVATGPGSVAANAGLPVRLVWNDPTLVPGQVRGGWLEVRSDANTSLGWVPVRIERSAGAAVPYALQSGVDHVLALAGSAANDGLYIDVPPGLARLDVTTSSLANVDLHLARIDAPAASGATPTVPNAPARNLASASAVTPTGNESLTVNNPAPGRWYVTPVNATGATADLTVRATLTGTGPQLRPGGFFNPERSGNGLFLYPAGDQWAGLWYTYLQDGTTTWYYLQGAAPASTSLWRGTIFRSAWNGSSNFLTPVGEATVTPRSTSAFTFSYTLDGETGSEAYENFGGGCPTFAGAPLNASGHWFDPARAGSGYSVQLFPNYEFYTVFGYDAQGVPRYLIAERSGVGAATETLTLAQNTGACPLCTRTGNPVRSTVGTLTRTFGSGTLQRIQLSGTFTSGVPGTWAANDAVTPLGTLQGCAAN